MPAADTLKQDSLIRQQLIDGVDFHYDAGFRREEATSESVLTRSYRPPVRADGTPGIVPCNWLTGARFGALKTPFRADPTPIWTGLTNGRSPQSPFENMSGPDSLPVNGLIDGLDGSRHLCGAAHGLWVSLARL